MTSMEDPGVNNRWCENDEKAKKENVSCLFQIDRASPPDNGKHDNEGAEEKEEGVGEFKEEKEERTFSEKAESVLYCEAGNNESKKGYAEGSQSERGIFDTLDTFQKKGFHIWYFSIFLPRIE